MRVWKHEDPGEAAQAIEQLVRDRTAEKQPLRSRVRRDRRVPHPPAAPDTDGDDAVADGRDAE
jgi:hypothetical protein